MAEESKVENVPVTSTTSDQPSEQPIIEKQIVDKKSIRKNVIKKLHKKKIASPNFFYQIPFFTDIEKATELLSETEEFKNAKNVKINFDRPQKGILIEALKSKKNIYLSAKRKSLALLDRVENAELFGENDEIKEKSIIEIFRSKEHKQEVPLTDKIELDLVVVGSLAVGNDGHRIGSENGYNDLELGILTQWGAITDKTIIVTTVHDDQIVDDLPTDIFDKFDYPLDLIVTPTKVIRVERKLKRPEGIYWDLLHEHRVLASPTLKQLYTDAIDSGKTIELRPIDENSSGLIRRRPFGMRTRAPLFRKGFNRRRPRSRQIRVSENGTDNVQEEKERPITKVTLRRNLWRHMAQNKLAEMRIVGKIPLFTDYAKATEKLVEMDEFKKAEHILTTNDKVFQNMKLNILNGKKNLYIPCYIGEDVLSKVKPMEDGTEATIEYLNTILSEKKFDLINMNNKIELDLVVLGSVLVSKSGQRISVGNRITDLYMSYLIELGFVTPKTKIVTMVHECQIQDIPNEVMCAYDLNVDVIITPNEIIKVDNVANRPSGVLWDHVYQPQLENSGVLKVIKEQKEAAGETIIVKPAETREFSGAKRNIRRGRFSNRRVKRNTENSDDSENRPLSSRRGPRRFMNRRRRVLNKREKNEAGNEVANQQKKQRSTKWKKISDAYCVKVSNIADGVQARDFKTEVRKLANPNLVSWNGKHRSCYLYYNRKLVDSNDNGIDNIVKDLEKLSIIDVEHEGQLNSINLKLNVKLLPNKEMTTNIIPRIESVDSTTV